MFFLFDIGVYAPRNHQGLAAQGMDGNDDDDDNNNEVHDGHGTREGDLGAPKEVEGPGSMQRLYEVDLYSPLALSFQQPHLRFYTITSFPLLR